MKNKLLIATLLLGGMAMTEARGAEPLPYHNTCDALTGMTQDIGSQRRNWTVSDGCIRIQPLNSNTRHDAYLWLPAITFNKDKTYRFAVDARYLRNYPGSFELVLSDQPSRNGNVTVLRDVKNVSTWCTPYDTYYNCTADAELYLGIHATGPGPADVFYLDNIYVDEVSARVPLPVIDMKATASGGGKKQTTISFTTPSKRVGGGRGLDLSKIDLFCDGDLIHSFDAPEKNAPLSYTFSSSMSGRHLFTALPYSPEGGGSVNHVLTQVGPAISEPSYVYNGRDWYYLIPSIYDDKTGKVTIRWSPREGEEKARYDIYRMPDNVKVASALTDTVFTEPAVKSDVPMAYYYSVNAVYNDSVKNMGTSSTVALYSAEPFHLLFNSPESVYECTVTEGEDSDTGWWNVMAGSDPHASVTASDDWLITPGVSLQAGKIYKISLNIFSGFKPGTFKLHIGRTNDYHGLDTQLMPLTMVKSKTGEIQSCYYRVPEDGQYFIGVHAYEPDADPYEVGPSLNLRRIDMEEVDESLPQAVGNLHVEYGKTDATKSQIVMTAPVKSLGDNDLTGTMSVILLKDGAQVAVKDNVTPGANVAFDITVKTEQKDVYSVMARNSAGEGPQNDVTVMLIIPAYLNEFDTKESIDGWSIFDVGLDGFTWNWWNNQLQCYPDYHEKPVEDWIMTPAIYLEKGKYYKTSFVVTNSKEAQAQNVVSLHLGREATPEAMTRKVIKDYEPWGVGYYERALLKDYFTVEETGTYHLGIHNTVDNGRYASPLLVDNFSITAKINGEVPDTITSYKVIANEDGELRGQVKFTVPVKALNGTALDKAKAIKHLVMINGKSVGTFDALPGENVGLPVTVDSVGVWLFTVVPFNDYGQGREAEMPMFFGINRAGNPYNVVAKENPEKYGEVTITWHGSAYDFDGFPMNQKHVSYEIIDISGGQENIIVTGLRDTTYTYQARTPQQEQQFMRFAVRARTSSGGSQGVYAPYIAVGKPYALPLKESFAGMSPKVTFLQQAYDESSSMAMWGFNSKDPAYDIDCYDGDGGLALMEVIFADCSRRLLSGKVDLRNAVKPMLSMRVLNYPGKTVVRNEIRLEVGTTTDVWDSIAAKPINEWSEGEKLWQRIEVDLSKYAGKIVYLGIVGTARSHTFTVIDAMEVAEAKDKNLGYVAYEIPEKANIGQTFPIEVRVKNHGHAKAEAGSYNVQLFRDGEAVQTLDGVALEPGAKHPFIFRERIDIDNATEHRYYVMINNKGDQDEYDNRTKSFTVAVEATDFPTVENLAGIQNTAGEIELSWKAPEIPEKAQLITDDFESYTSWATQWTGIGKYNFLDYDDYGIAGIKGVELPGIEINSKQSWFVFDNTMEPFNNNANAVAHSGHKYLACMTPYVSSPSNYADDWIISPELCGDEQTISFWARSFQANRPENFMISWSYDGITFRDFAHEETSYPLVGVVPAEWTKYEYKLPQGAKFFTIRRWANNGFMMFVDDLSFIPAGHERLKLQGYNVYYNGKQLNGTTPVTATAFRHRPDKDGVHTYSVAAQYDLGQSALADVNVGFTGIGFNDADMVSVAGVKGHVIVKGALNMPVEIYSADGLRVYAATPDTDMLSVPVAAGVYAVNVAGKSFKVIVR